MARQRIEFIFRLIKLIIKFNIFNLIRIAFNNVGFGSKRISTSKTVRYFKNQKSILWWGTRITSRRHHTRRLIIRGRIWFAIYKRTEISKASSISQIGKTILNTTVGRRPSITLNNKLSLRSTWLDFGFDQLTWFNMVVGAFQGVSW